MKGEMSEIVVTIQPMWDDNKNQEILSLWRILFPSNFQVLQLSGMIPLMTFLKYFFFFFFAVLGLCCCTGFSLVAVSGGYSLAAVCRLLIVVASLVAKHRL